MIIILIPKAAASGASVCFISYSWKMCIVQGVQKINKHPCQFDADLN